MTANNTEACVYFTARMQVSACQVTNCKLWKYKDFDGRSPDNPGEILGPAMVCQCRGRGSQGATQALCPGCHLKVKHVTLLSASNLA